MYLDILHLYIQKLIRFHKIGPAVRLVVTLLTVKYDLKKHQLLRNGAERVVKADHVISGFCGLHAAPNKRDEEKSVQAKGQRYGVHKETIERCKGQQRG